MRAMLLGSERLVAVVPPQGLRVGVSPTLPRWTTTSATSPSRLSVSSDYSLTAIFGPQHGYRSDLQDNMIETPHDEDPRRNVPIFSLYSETREPTPEMLALIDVLVVDLQDVGARIYTFIYTMANCLRAMARARQSRDRHRPAQPDRRAPRRRADARAGIRVASSGSSGCRCGTA